ncbi:MAG: lamin tail domain-containing protein [Flavobacteriales bacterium]|nr:lamin tail domain-containing protein [Flavobacteriales bacterium]
MKKLLFLFVLLCAFEVKAQFFDDFSDGDFTANPTWSGDTSLFTITSGQLNSKSPTAATYSISTPSSLSTNVEFIFDINLKFATSGSNYVDVLLMSDSALLTTTQNGYFVRIGSTQDDLKLYKIVSGVETLLIDGADGSVNSSTNNSFRIKVTRDASDVWTLLYDDGILGTYTNAGTISDNSVNSSSFFGFKIIQSSAASVVNNHFFDTIYVGTIGADLTPPSILSISVIDSTKIDVFFSETIELISAQNNSNYLADNGLGNPISAIRDAVDSSLVHLIFSTAFANSITNTLTINNVEDLSGNPLINGIKTFIYSVVSIPSLRDVVINEIFADPSPQIGLPNAEFVELYNVSNQAFNLSGWKFINSTTAKSLPNYILPPNGFVILCNSTDTALYSSYGSVIGISSFTALTNGGDSLTLTDSLGNLLDVVSYDLSWYQDPVKDDGGYTLELINPIANCSGALNWIGSFSTDGGTPGSQNSVYDISPDMLNPKITNVDVVSLTQLTVFFDETMDSSSLANTNIIIDNGINVMTRTITSTPNKIDISFSPAIDSSTVYTIQLGNATDCSGNILTPDSIKFGIGVSPNPTEIVITELFPDYEPSIGLPLYEYVELYNNTSKVINLSNLKLSDPLTTSGTLSGKLMPNEYLIVCGTSSVNQFSPYGKTCGISSFPSLNNSDDEIKLVTSSGTIIHQVNYFDSWYQDESKKDGGWSLEMVDPNNPCGEINNWRASTKWFGGTPGTQNSVYGTNPDIAPPTILSIYATSDSTVQITFNESLFFDSIYINTAVLIDSVIYSNSKTLTVYLTTKLLPQTTYLVSIFNVTDCVGNVQTLNSSFSLPEQGILGDIVINEVLFNPFTGGSDFVEIYNKSDKYISLQNWELANYDNDSISNRKIISSSPLLLLPKQFLVLTKDKANIKTEYILAKDDRILQIDALPTYNNDKGNVYLQNNINQTVDNFGYSEKMHFALLNDFKGVSLERIDYDRPSNELTNWHSAAEDVGYATPGYENSQYKNVEPSSEVSLDPETFSPDNDGFDDVLNISYQFEKEGYVANIVIYDVKGRLIRNLILNQLLGTKGTFSWDGINDNNEKAAIGIYIVYFEAFKVDGETKKIKKTAVLGGHL